MDEKTAFLLKARGFCFRELLREMGKPIILDELSEKLLILIGAENHLSRGSMVKFLEAPRTTIYDSLARLRNAGRVTTFVVQESRKRGRPLVHYCLIDNAIYLKLLEKPTLYEDHIVYALDALHVERYYNLYERSNHQVRAQIRLNLITIVKEMLGIFLDDIQAERLARKLLKGHNDANYLKLLSKEDWICAMTKIIAYNFDAIAIKED